MQPQKPTIGRIVHYRARGGYMLPAMICATQETLTKEGVERGDVPALSSPDHVHLVVFTPGLPGRGLERRAQLGVPADNVPAGGTYQEHNVQLDLSGSAEQVAGTWCWPERV